MGYFLNVETADMHLIACKQPRIQKVQENNCNNQMHKKIEEPFSCLSCVFPQRDVSAESKKEREDMLAIFTFLFSFSHLFTSYPVWMVSRYKLLFLL